jgi:DNA topoisomerase-2
VNSICTSKGGTHVNYLVDQIVQKLIAAVSKKNTPTIKPFQVKAHLRLFVNCLIDNPCFDSQIKENLTTHASQFGSVCEISPEFIKELLKTGIVDSVLNDLKAK